MHVVAVLRNAIGCVMSFISEGMPAAVALTLMMAAGKMKAGKRKHISVIKI